MDDLLHRQVPHSIEAEQAVIGSMLIDERCVPEIIGLLKVDDFYSNANRDIYQTIFTMFNFSKPIDPVTVLDNMRAEGVLNDDSPSYIRDLFSLTPTSANAMEYAQIVKDKALLRAIADTGSDINTMAVIGEGGADNILEAAEKRIYSLRQGRDREELRPISKVLLDAYEQINKASKEGSGIPGLTTGLHEIDRTIMGLNKSDLIIIASRPGMGKTSIALNIALHVARTSDRSVAVFSLEMSCEQLALRLMSSESFIDGKKLQTGRLSPNEWQRLIDATTSISKAKLLISDKAAITVSDMNAQCRRVPDLGLVIVDYLQLMQSAATSRGYGSENRVQVVSEITRMLKIMAKELNVPVVCLSQLSRKAEERKSDKRPLLSDLRESGSIEQDADIVLGLYRDEYYNPEAESHIAECLVLKNRRGEVTKIELQWSPEYTTYTSVERRYDDD